MRILLVVTALVMLAPPAFAQGMSGGMGMHGGKGRRHASQRSEAEKQKRQAADAAYKAALGQIPDQPKADPWRNAR